MGSNRRFATPLTAGLLVALALGSLAMCAEESPAKKWAADLQIKLLQKIDVELDETTFDELVGYIRQQAGVAVIVDPLVFQRANEIPDSTLSVNECPIGEAIAKLLEPLDLQYAIRDEAIFIYKRNAYGDSAPNTAALSDTQVTALNKAVADLAAEDFEVRESASARLEKLGAAAAPHLTNALKITTDPETQMRLQKILTRFTAKPFPGPSAEVSKRLDALDTPVKFDLVDMTLGDAVATIRSELAHKGGKPFLIKIANEELLSMPVNIPGANMQAGNLLRWLSIASGATLVLDGENLKMVASQKAAERSFSGGVPKQ